MTDLQAATAKAIAADEVWMAALRKHFGSKAVDARYEMDKSKHPLECRNAHAALVAARNEASALRRAA
ncbi:MAG: hypothetical protein AAGK00_18500 [Pseudomonadota bacterium]